MGRALPGFAEPRPSCCEGGVLLGVQPTPLQPQREEAAPASPSSGIWGVSRTASTFYANFSPRVFSGPGGRTPDLLPTLLAFTFGSNSEKKEARDTLWDTEVTQPRLPCGLVSPLLALPEASVRLGRQAGFMNGLLTNGFQGDGGCESGPPQLRGAPGSHQGRCQLCWFSRSLVAAALPHVWSPGFCIPLQALGCLSAPGPASL